MSDKKMIKPVTLAVGAALASTFAFGSSIASANTVESPFAIATLSAGYLLGQEGSGGGGQEGDKEGEAHCGGDKEGEAHCGAKEGEAHCGGDKDGEAHCGAKDAEGSCGESKKEAENAISGLEGF